MVQVKWTKRALRDVREIYDFIAKDSQYYARLQVEKICESVSNLVPLPELGHYLPEFPDSPYKQILCDNYRIIYRFQKEQMFIYIIAVVHGK